VIFIIAITVLVEDVEGSRLRTKGVVVQLGLGTLEAKIPPWGAGKLTELAGYTERWRGTFHRAPQIAGSNPADPTILGCIVCPPFFLAPITEGDISCQR
jgi:hypothetical protein